MHHITYLPNKYHPQNTHVILAIPRLGQALCGQALGQALHNTQRACPMQAIIMLPYALLCMFYCINDGLMPINSWGSIKLLTYRRFWIVLVVDLQCPKAPADGGCLAWANATCTNITGKPEIGCKDGTICCDLSPPNCQDEYQYCVKPVPMHEFPGKYLAISRPQAYLRSISNALVRAQ